MTQPKFHLAQYNIIKLKADINAPIISEFKDFLGPVNALADKSEGFIWRLKGEDGTSAADIFTPYDDPLIYINMSVWESIESMENYIYKTVHSYFLKNRKKWGTHMEGTQAVMWWVPEGHIPTVEEGIAKLELLNARGSSSEAFSFREKYNAQGELM